MGTIEAFQSATDDLRGYASALGIGGWLKLAAIILVVSLGPSLASYAYRGATLAGLASGGSGLVPPAGLLALTGVVFVGTQYLTALSDLVIVQSLCTTRLPVRQYARGNLQGGAKLLGFRLAVLVATAALVAAPLVATGTTSPEAIHAVGPTVGLVVALVGLLAGVGYLLVTTLTTAFVVPIMQREHRGPISGWRRFWAGTVGNRLAVAGYLLAVWVVGFVVAVGKYIVSTVSSVLLFSMGIFAYSAVEGTPVLSAVVVGFFAGGYLLSLYVIAVVVDAPVRGYLRYAALELLGTADDDLDFLPTGGETDP